MTANQLFSSVQNSFLLTSKKKIHTNKNSKLWTTEYSKLFSKKSASSKCYFRKVYKLSAKISLSDQVIFTRKILYTQKLMCMCLIVSRSHETEDRRRKVSRVRTPALYSCASVLVTDWVPETRVTDVNTTAHKSPLKLLCVIT